MYSEIMRGEVQDVVPGIDSNHEQPGGKHKQAYRRGGVGVAKANQFSGVLVLIALRRHAGTPTHLSGRIWRGAR
jgi:hypothetical protein